ncbi:MAG: serine hydrolase [Planctomycetota bacterium]
MRVLAALIIVSLSLASILAQDAKPAEPADEVPEVELTEDAQLILEKLDKNDDGKISESELPQRGRKLYMRFDTNGDGALSGDELNKAANAAADLKSKVDKRTKDKVASGMKESYEPDEASGLYLDAARDYNRLTNGEALYVMKDGKFIYEGYDNGYDKAEEHQLASGTKSYNGIIAACAVEDELIEWDELVCNTVTEWKDDPRLSKITVRMLLSLCAGLPPEQDALQGFQTQNKYEYAIGLECKYEPGKKFEYGPAQYFAWGEFMRRKLANSEKYKDMNLTDYFMHRIGDAIGIKQTWRTDRAGNPATPHGVFVTAGEWAKFGEFVRLGGKVGDKQLLKTELMDECFKPSPCNAGYGLTWWLAGSDSSDGDTGGGAKDAQGRSTGDTPKWMPSDLVFAAGKGTQRLFISRKLGLTIVRFADDKDTFDNNEFMSWLLRGKAN